MDPVLQCPEATVMTLFADRRLASAPAADVERHLERCAACRRLVSELAPDRSNAVTRPDRSDAGSPPPGEPGARYVIERELARGGMGRISIARDTRLGRTVAIKELLVPSPVLAARFQRELSLTARLQHPSIVSIHDGGTWPGGEPYYVMRLVTGQPLDRLIASRASRDARLELLPYAIAMVDALAYAHASGIIHRDLKPANVLVGDFGDTVVIDWGLAKDLRAADHDPDAEDVSVDVSADGVATVAGAVIGTPAYMSPEQARGEPLDARADVYALGAVLYHLLAGVAPHRGRSVAEILKQVAGVAPPPLDAIARGVPRDLIAIVDKAMAASPGDRYADAGPLAVDLKRFQLGQLVGAHRYSAWQLARRWLRRHRTAVAVAAIAAVALLVTGALAIRRIVAEQRRAERNRANAEELMTFMLTDLRDKLEPIGKLELLGTVAKKARDYYDQVELAGGDDASPAKQALARSNLGRVLFAQGDTAGALVEYRAARALIERLAAGAPDDAGWQHELSDAHRRIGEALEVEGDLPAARVEYQAARSIDERQVARDPARPVARADLLQSRLGLGHVLEAQGDTAAALVEDRAALALAEPLAAAEPHDPQRQRALYVCHQALGAALEHRGDADGALAEYRAADALAAARLAVHPDDAEAERDGWLTRESLGRVLVARGELAAGLAQQRGALAIAERLVARDPTNVVWQRDLAASHNEVGNALVSGGDTAGALVELRAGQDVIGRVAAQAPADTDVQRDVEVSASRVGAALESRGELAAALVQYRAALAVAERLAARDPTSATFRSDLAMSHNDVGSALQAGGDGAGALAEFRAAAAQVAGLVARDPGNAELIRQQWALAINIGDVLLPDDPAAALASYRDGAALALARAARRTDDGDAQADACVSHVKVGAALDAIAAAAPAGAERDALDDQALGEYQAALAIAEARRARPGAPIEWQDHAVTSHAKAAAHLRRRGREAAARIEYRAALAIAEDVARREPGNPTRARTVTALRAELAGRTR